MNQNEASRRQRLKRTCRHRRSSSSASAKPLQDHPEPKRQLCLPYKYLPRRLKEHGVADAHSYPLVADRRDDDSLLVTRVPAELAWDHPLVEWGRTGNSFAAIVLDVDTQEALERIAAANMGASAVPTPNLVAYRLLSGHGHAIWTLKRPVHRGAAARPGPLAVLARVTEWLRCELQADAGYTGVLVANPEHADYETAWLRVAGYGLAELREPIPHGWRRPRRPTTDIGRNCAVFTKLRSWIGRPANWEAPLEEIVAHAYAMNATFPVGMSNGEVQGIARSVHHIHLRKMRSGEQQSTFSMIQSFRGAKNSPTNQAAKGRQSGEARRHRTQERDQRILRCLEAGCGVRQVARSEGLHHRTVSDIRDRQRGERTTDPGGGRTTKAG